MTIVQGAPAGAPSVPVVIIGGGACGMVAALTLADAGIACVVLERDVLPQGSTALSSGFIPACNTRWQRALEYHRSWRDTYGRERRSTRHRSRHDHV